MNLRTQPAMLTLPHHARAPFLDGRPGGGGRKAVPPPEVKFAGEPLSGVAADGRFEGYASLFGVVDLGGDIVEPGAFRDSLIRRGVTGVKLLWQHDPAEPIGIWTDIVEDARGLHVVGRLDLAVARAREVQALMRSRAVDGLSIGFKTLRSRREAASGRRRLEKIDLWEISIVTFPMQPGARVSRVKQLGTPPLRPPAAGDAPLVAALHRAIAAFR